MYCKHCLRMIVDDSIICPSCGKSLKKSNYKKFVIFAVCFAVLAMVSAILILSKKNEDAMPLETVVQGVENAMIQSGFQCTVSYDETGITVDSIYPDFAFYANAAIENGGEDLQGWNELVDSICGLAESIEEYVNLWYEDITFCLCVFNDQNPDNMLIMIIDGEVVYDVVNGA